MTEVPKRLNFETKMRFERQNFKGLKNKAGCYMIFTNDLFIPYPFLPSRLIYIGVSKKDSNGMQKRLENHFDGKGNRGVFNYKSKDLYFTYQEASWLSELINADAAELEKYLILDFADKYGCYPICNGRKESKVKNIGVSVEANWKKFE